MFLEWIDVMSLARDESALQEFKYFLDTFTKKFMEMGYSLCIQCFEP